MDWKDSWIRIVCRRSHCRCTTHRCLCRNHYQCICKFSIVSNFVLTNLASSWHYNSDKQITIPKDQLTEDQTYGDKYSLTLDAWAYGNLLRFVNHDDKPNCDVVLVDHANRWHVLCKSPLEKTLFHQAVWQCCSRDTVVQWSRTRTAD